MQLPEQLVNELLDIRSHFDRIGLRLGKAAVLALAYCHDVYPTATDEQIYSYVGSLAGKRARTVREYAAVVAYYGSDGIAQFETLSFDHFRTALRLRPEGPEELLAWAEEQTSIFNRPATVDQMAAHFSTNKAYSKAVEDGQASPVDSHESTDRFSLPIAADSDPQGLPADSRFDRPIQDPAVAYVESDEDLDIILENAVKMIRGVINNPALRNRLNAGLIMAIDIATSTIVDAIKAWRLARLKEGAPIADGEKVC